MLFSAKCLIFHYFSVFFPQEKENYKSLWEKATKDLNNNQNISRVSGSKFMCHSVVVKYADFQCKSCKFKSCTLSNRVKPKEVKKLKENSLVKSTSL